MTSFLYAVKIGHLLLTLADKKSKIGSGRLISMRNISRLYDPDLLAWWEVLFTSNSMCGFGGNGGS